MATDSSAEGDQPTGDPEYQEVRDLFHELFELPAEVRTARLDELAPSPTVRREVEALLAGHEEPLPFEEGELGTLGQKLVLDAAPDEFGLPDRIGDYRILSKLGEGGMGVVYAAQRADEHETLALKLIRPGLDVERLTNRFLREVRVLERLRHPGIAAFRDAGTTRVQSGSGVTQLPYLAMELIEGRSLHVYCRERGLDDDQRVELVARTLDALEAAHGHGIVHRDLKPENVLVVDVEDDPVGQPKLLDFGVAQAMDTDFTTLTRTQTGMLIGTLPYMSPEQVSSQGRIDRRSDVYAMGVLCFEVLTGRLPYEVRDLRVLDAARVIQEKEPDRLGWVQERFRGSLEGIVGRALEKDRADRYATAAGFAEDLRRHLRGEPPRGRRTSVLHEVRKFTRRHRALVGSVVAVVLALSIGLAVAVRYAIAEAHARGVADRNARDALRAAYRASMRAGASAVAEGDAGMAELEIAQAPESLRGWEWRHLSAATDDSDWSRTLDGTGDGGNTVLSYTLREGCVAAMRSGKLAAYDLVDGECVLERDLPEGARVSLVGDAFMTQDGAALRIFSLPDGELLVEHPLTDDSFEVRTARLARKADGSWLVTNRQEVLQIDADGGGRVLGWMARAQRGVRFSADGAWALSQRDSQGFQLTDQRAQRLFDVEAGVSAGGTLAISPGGKFVASSFKSGGIGVWQIHDDRPPELWKRLAGRSALNARLAFSPDDRLLAVASSAPRIDLWDLESGMVVRSLKGRRGPVSHLGFSPSGDRLTCFAINGEVRTWSVRHDPRAMNIGSWLYAIALEADTDTLFAGTKDGELRAFDLYTGVELSRVPLTSDAHIETLSLDPSRRRLAVSVERTPTLGRAFVIDLTDGHVVWRAPVSAGREVASFSPTGDLAVLSSEGVLTLMDGGTLEPIAQRATEAVDWKPDLALAFAPDGGSLAVGVADRLRLFEGRTLEPVAELADLGANVTRVAFSPDGESLAVSSLDGRIRIVEVPAGRTVATLTGHDETVFGVAWSSDGTRLFSASRDATIRVWDTATWEDLTYLKGHGEYVYSVLSHPDGETVFSCGGDGIVRSWGVEPLSALNAAARDYREVVERWSPIVRQRVGAAERGARIESDLPEELTGRERRIVEQLFWASTFEVEPIPISELVPRPSRSADPSSR